MSESVPLASRRPAFVRLLDRLPLAIGEIVIESGTAGDFGLRHRDDLLRADLTRYTAASAAVALSRFDDAGKYRPLKTAPNLRHGWTLLLSGVEEVRAAVDHFYPARIAAFEAADGGRLTTTPFRQTLERQSGMYRAASKIADGEANELIAGFCRSDVGCLRTILWPREAKGRRPSTLLPAAKFDPDYDQTGRGERMMPLLCQEACNLLVAEARKIVKLR